MGKALYKITVDKNGVSRKVIIDEVRKTRDGEYKPKKGDHISISVKETDKIKCNPIRVYIDTYTTGYREKKYKIEKYNDYVINIYTLTPELYRDSHLIEFRARKRNEQITDIFKTINAEK